ncbi:Mos2 [Thalictrum thalictroides]|uniref:Mos2 n=1 Tax=Thalictrum thalictroides TaxID=46969 RepID=A0A7J6URV9_THATH|nr:Mos2 [Thalictrum thalictroides]
MKLSFSLNSNPSSNPKPKSPDNFIDAEEEEEENSPKTTSFITEAQALTPTQPPKLIIPPLQNTWKPYNNNLESNFESISTSTTSYGLNLRPKKKKQTDDDNESNTSNLSMELKLVRKFREDIKKLPDDKGLDEFRDIPIEGFGKALLSGYGWHEGKGIGKNAKQDVKVVQYEGRIGRAGLGFVPQNDSAPTNKD